MTTTSDGSRDAAAPVHVATDDQRILGWGRGTHDMVIRAAESVAPEILAQRGHVDPRYGPGWLVFPAFLPDMASELDRNRANRPCWRLTRGRVLVANKVANTKFGSPKRGKKPGSRPAPGRLCQRPGCTTVLSTYNSSATCWYHSDTR